MLNLLRPPARFAGGLTATIVELERGFLTEGHRHELATVVIVLDAVVVERQHRSYRELPPGTILSIAPHASRDLRVDGDRARVAIISANRGSSLARQPMAQRGGLLNTDLAVARRIDSLLASSDRIDGRIESTLLELFAASSDGETREPPSWLNHVLESLRSTNGAISSRALALGAGCHPVVLAREFRRSRGLGIREYARRVRLECALALLGTPDLTLAMIAHRAGFADQSHFTREFGRRFGAPPGRFRQTAGAPAVSSVQDRPFPGVHLGTMHTPPARHH